MRKIIVPALTVLLGVTVALGIYKSAFVGRPAAHGGAGILGALAQWLPTGEPDTLREPRAKAARLLQGGQLREAQDAFLDILTRNPRDESALRGLVVVRRYMAGDNPGVLRRQAAEYWEAIKRGAATAEHYSPGSMEVLLAATLQAVQEIEARAKSALHAPQVPTPQAATPQAATPQAAQPRDAAPPSGTLPVPAARPSKPTVPAASAPSAGKLPASAPPVAKAAPSAKAVGPQPPILSAGRVPASTPAAKPAATPPAVPSTGKAPTPAASPAKATAPSAAIPSSAPAPKDSVKPRAPAAQTPPPAAGNGASPLPTIAAPQTSTAPPASPRQTSPSTAEPAASVSNRLYTVRVGPVSDRGLASAIAAQLSAGGFSATNVSSRSGFRVVSEPLPRNVAEGLAASMAGRGIHTQVEALGGDAVQLVFGSFASQKEAEALSQRVTALGYDAWVREGAVYTLQLGPYPQSAVNTITGIVKSNAPGAPVTADPVP